jgi:hypothetical protein
MLVDPPWRPFVLAVDDDPAMHDVFDLMFSADDSNRGVEVVSAPQGSRSQSSPGGLPKPRTMADYAQWFANRGGTAKAKGLTAKERTAIGKKGAEARWSTTKKRPT